MEKLEFLDEVNLLHDLLRHYCISWAFKDPKKLGDFFIDFFAFFSMLIYYVKLKSLSSAHVDFPLRSKVNIYRLVSRRFCFFFQV